MLKRKKIMLSAGLLLLLLALLLCVSACGGKEKPAAADTPSVSQGPTATPETDYTEKHLKVTAVDTGYDMYAPIKGSNWGYHYGPAILLNEDGSIDTWFASPGKLEELDWFAYTHSDDGGKNWTDEKIVLYPTASSLDELSVCDPSVLHFGDYYYIGYTSTIDGTGGGLCNSAFVARSKNPDGPFEKWNGSGWGGKPWPVVYFPGRGSDWGCGEPSMVVVGDTLYFYHSMDSSDTENRRSSRCYVYTADATSENWPATMEYQGLALDYTAGTKKDGYVWDGHDSIDVAYVEAYKKFIAVGTNRRFGNESCIVYYESNDGLSFTRVSELNTNILAGCHNAGIMKDGNGHIKEGDKAIIGYGYAGADNATWGFWATRFNEIEISITDEIDRSDEKNSNVRDKMPLWDAPDDPHLIALSTSPHEYKKNLGKGPFAIKLYAFDSTYKQLKVTDVSKIKYSGYDETILSVDGLTITPLKAGETVVTVEYEGLTQQFSVIILPDNVKLSKSGQKIVSFEPTVKEYTVSLSGKDARQIRSLATFENRNFCELYNNSKNISFPPTRYPVTFESSDKSVAAVGNDCMIRAKKVGDATITVSCGDFSYDVVVHVTE